MTTCATRTATPTRHLYTAIKPLFPEFVVWSDGWITRRNHTRCSVPSRTRIPVTGPGLAVTVGVQAATTSIRSIAGDGVGTFLLAHRPIATATPAAPAALTVDRSRPRPTRSLRLLHHHHIIPKIHYIIILYYYIRKINYLKYLI